MAAFSSLSTRRVATRSSIGLKLIENAPSRILAAADLLAL
jgi:hypothetical protein